MAMLSSGGRLLLIGAAPMVLSLVDGPASIMEGRMSGSAKSEEMQRGRKKVQRINVRTEVAGSLCKLRVSGRAEVGPSQGL